MGITENRYPLNVYITTECQQCSLAHFLWWQWYKNQAMTPPALHYLPLPPPPSLYIRVESDFGNKNVTLSMLCQIVIGPQFQNLAFSCYFLTCRIYRASENVDCYPNLSKHSCCVKPGNIFFNFQIKYYTCFNFKLSCDCSLMNV